MMTTKTKHLFIYNLFLEIRKIKDKNNTMKIMFKDPNPLGLASSRLCSFVKNCVATHFFCEISNDD